MLEFVDLGMTAVKMKDLSTVSPSKQALAAQAMSLKTLRTTVYTYLDYKCNLAHLTTNIIINYTFLDEQFTPIHINK